MTPSPRPSTPEEVEGEPDAVSAAVGHMEVESDSGDVTVEVEALSLVEARIEATLEGDDEQVAADDLDDSAAADRRPPIPMPTPTAPTPPSQPRPDADASDDVDANLDAVAASSEQPDTTLETGEFEMSELGVGTDDPQTSAEVIEAEFEADDLTSVTADSDDAEEADDEEELSASSSTATKFVAGPRDNDD